MEHEKILKSLNQQSLMSVITPQSIPIIAVSSAVDFSSLYVMLNDVLTQNRLFLYVLVGAIGFLLALMPTVWVHLYKQRHYKLQHVPRALLIAMPIIFIGIILVIFWLRYETRNLEFEMDQASIIIGGQVSQRNETGNPAATPMAFLLCVVPVVTAMVNLFMAWIFDNPIKEQIQKLELAKIALADDIAELEAINAEYAGDEGYKQRMLEEENDKFHAVNGEIDAKAEYYKAYVRERIAERLKDPASTSALTTPAIY